ncbi:hypothetical protein [Streptosporangium lutulentum]|uniref:Secreted protein n=1 Tax=Streptosporangium lutulentum TaxID=1461250 RepID=A0ABT9QAI7_9ACTN|nr:hypothetical protein [Streptosporangium lutulentum]MDP9843079.1 hypothetical protein [Streptosporangium lutulentum]
MQVRQRGAERVRTVAVIGAAVVARGGLVAPATVPTLKERSRSSLDAVRTVAVTRRERGPGARPPPSWPPGTANSI